MDKQHKNLAQRVLAAILCVAMLLPVFPQSAWAEELSGAVLQSATPVEAADVLSGLPYSGGSGSNILEYDCGDGLTSDGATSAIRIIQNTTAAQFNTYCTSVLEAKGLRKIYDHSTLDSRNNQNYKNLFRKYVAADGSYSVYTYFLAYYNEVRIIVDSNRDTVQGYQYTKQTGKTAEPLMVQWGLSTSSSGYHIDTTKTVNGSVLNTGRENNGALIIIRMPDNSLFFYDGGILAQMSDEAAAELLAFCRELTGTTATREKMVINTWFLSHAHDDHFQGFTRFININHEEFDLKNVVYNIDIERDLEGANSTTPASKNIRPTMQMIKEFYPNVRYYKPHTGEGFNVAGIQFDVMYAHEDRLLPSSNRLSWATDARYASSPKDIWDLGGTYRDGLYLRKDGAVQTQDGQKRSDFNDTSTVLKVTFPQSVNGGGKDVTAILYADMNLAEEIVKNVHPASALSADIVMVPHHGFDAHAALVTGKAKIFLYTQNYKPIFGTGVYCRTDLKDNFNTMFPNQTTPSGKTTDSYKIYWGGNETAIIDLKKVSNLASSAKRDAIAACVETREGMDFPYTGWGLYAESDLDQTGVTTLEGYVDPATVTTGTTIENTKQIQFKPMGVFDLPIQEGRYLIRSNKYGYIMAHDATKPLVINNGTDAGTDVAGSLTLDTNGNSLDTYYLNQNGYIILDHSNRDRVIWNMRQYGQAKDNNTIFQPNTPMNGSAVQNGQYLGYINWNNFGNWSGLNVGISTGRIIEGIELQKRTMGFSQSAYGTYNPSNKYWLSVTGDTCFLRYNQESTPFKTSGVSDTSIRKKFVIEIMQDGTHLIYYKANDNEFYFVRCDEYGTWGVKKYTKADAVADLENLKLKLYTYEELSSNKKVALSGYKTYRVSVGTSADAVMSAIMENVVVSDPTRQNQYIPCSGVNWTSAKVGYYFLRWGTNDQPVTYLPNTPGTYKVGVYYCNDRNAGGNADFDLIGTVDVIVKDVTYSIEDSQKEGYVSQNSYGQVHLAADSAEIAKFIFDDEVIEVTVGMLKNADGTPVDTSVSKDYTGLKLIYSGYTICNDFTLHVAKGTMPADIPVFPADGSVKADKDTTTSDEQFAQTGVANIQLSAAAMPIERGVDLIIMLDLSSSMRYQVSSDTPNATADSLSYVSHPTHLANGTTNPEWNETDWKKTRMYAMEQSLSSLITTLAGSGADVNIAMADFGDLDHYEFENAVIDPNRRAWPQLEHNLVDANSATIGDLEFNYRNEIANHRNFILGRDDPTFPNGAAITASFRSQPFALSYRKYGPRNLSYGYDWVVNGSTDKSYRATAINPEYYGKILPKIYTGTGDVSGSAFESVASLNGKMGSVIQELRISNSKLLGTNYDVGLEYAYRLAYERQQYNIANGEQREIICIFMSDGAALQYNYFSGRTHSEAWSQAIIGNTDEILQDSEDEIKAGTTNDKNAYAWDLTRDANGNLKYYSYMHSTVQQKLQHMHQHLANGSLKNPSKVNYNRCSCGTASSPNAKGENFFAHLIAANSTESVSWYRFFRIMSTNADNGNLASFSGETNVKQKLFQALSQPDNDKPYQTDSPYYYFYNPDGKNWWAEAIKGDAEKIYPVINKYALGTNSIVGNDIPGTQNYNGEFTNKYAPTLADGQAEPAWYGKDYISGFKGLGLKLYTVGFSLLDERRVGADECTTVLKNLCTSPEGYYYSASNTSELGKALTEIVKKTNVSATLTYYTDTMGAEYDLATNQFVPTPSGASVQVSTNAYIEAKAYNLNANGVRTGTYTGIEKITFASNGSKSATSDQLGNTDIWNDTTNIITGKKIIYNANKVGDYVDVNQDGNHVLNDGDVVNGQYKIDLTGDGVGDYVLQPETFFWTIGFLSETEVVMEYQVYLEGSMEGEKQYSYGVYPTNTQATLDFYDYLGNNRTIETVSPEFPWGGSPKVGYGFYLVDQFGNPITSDYAQTSFANSHKLTEISYQDVEQNSTTLDEQALFAVSRLDTNLYELYSPDAEYTVKYNEPINDKTYNFWQTTDSTNTTYVATNGSGNYVSSKTNYNANIPNATMDSSEVYYAVRLIPKAQPEVIVIDFGQPVYIDVLANDGLSTGSTLEGINVASTHPSNGVAPTNYVKTTKPDQFGDVMCDDANRVKYSIKTMEMFKEDVFSYVAKDYTTGLYYYSTVTVIPATTIYYEDDFVTFKTHNRADGTEIMTSSVWSDSGTEVDATQAQDRPGEDVNNALGNLDADNVYGYDGAYTEFNAHSQGYAKKATVNANTYGTATFSFYGTGFDVISLSNKTTGTIVVSVYDYTEYKNYLDSLNGENPISKPTSKKDAIVDTYYGYKYENGSWVVDPTESATLYQVPVVKISDLTYGRYTAVITISYTAFFDHQKDGSYDFYLDAIRIYDPANDGNGNNVIKDAYVADSEGWPEYFELRNLLINKNDFDSINNSTTDSVPGIIFIDGFPALQNSNGNHTNDSSSANLGDKSAAVKDYANFGPNNELYLAQGQAVAFQLSIPESATAKVASIQLAFKSVGGEAYIKVYDANAQNKPNVVAPSSTVDSRGGSKVSTATDLYYNITSLNNKTVVIANTGSSGILSITNIKVTYTAEYTNDIDNGLTTTNLVAMNAIKSINALFASEGEQDPGEVVNGTINIAGASLSFEDEILTNLYYTLSGVEATEMGLLTWSAEPADGNIDNAENVFVGAKYDAQKDRYMVQTSGIAAKNLGDTIYMRVYAKTAEGVVYSDLVTYSPKQYAMSRLEKSTNADMKALCVAMLNYGAAAQQYFGYKTDALMNAELTAEQKALASDYSADLFAGAVKADGAKIGAFTKTDGFATRSASVSFDGAFAINYYFAPDAKMNGDMTFYYWSAEDYANADVLTAENATGTSVMELTDNGSYWANITGIAAKQLDETFYVAAVYTDAAGNTHCTGVIAYSLSTYCMKNAVEGNAMKQLAEATAVYGYHASVYFGNEA